MKAAVEPFSLRLKSVRITEPTVPMVFNRDGLEAKGATQVRDRIAGQLVRPIRWDLVMQRLIDMGITQFVEIGPGRVLRGLVRLNCNDPKIAIHNVSDLRSLDRMVNKLEEAGR